MVLTPRERKLEEKLEEFRTDETAKAALEERVAGYEREEHDDRLKARAAATAISLAAYPWQTTDGSEPAAPATPVNLRPSSPSRSVRSTGRSVRSAGSGRSELGTVFRPSSPTLGTAHSWSCLDTTSVDATGDPVGGWKDIRNQVPEPGCESAAGSRPPMRFGTFFESEGARRREYAERVTPALMGPKEEPLGRTPIVRDTESVAVLLHSPLPGTLRPTPLIDRASQRSGQIGWTPISRRQPAWSPAKLGPAPITGPPPPVQGGSAGVQRAVARAAERASPRRGRPMSADHRARVLKTSAHTPPSMPLHLSMRAQRQLADDKPSTITAAQLRRLVSGNPGSRLVSQLRDLDSFTLPSREVRAQRSLVSTRIASAHGGARMKLLREHVLAGSLR